MQKPTQCPWIHDECKILLAQRLLLVRRGQKQVYVPKVRTHLPGSHPQISGNQVGVPKLYRLLAKSLTPLSFLQVFHSLLP